MNESRDAFERLDPKLTILTWAIHLVAAPGVLRLLRTVTSPVDGSQRGYQISCRWLALCALLTATGGMLASCDTPIGVSPALQGTYRATSLVTNPNGDGPQVVRWGPPEGATGRH